MVLLFVILGTFYDISLRYQVLTTEKKGQSIGNIMTEMKMFNADEPVESEITIAKLWSVKKHNGSLGNVRKFQYILPIDERIKLINAIYLLAFHNYRCAEFRHRTETVIGGTAILQYTVESVETF